MKLSIVIPAHNEEDYISSCLDSVVRHALRDGRVEEVVVVDNASTDKTSEVAGSFPGVRVVNEPQKGLPHARQKGLEAVKGDLVAYLDADTTIEEDWLDIIYNHFHREEDLICLSGPVYFFDLSKGHNRVLKAYYSLVATPAHKAVGHMVIGGNFVAKKESLESMGGFDTDISFYGEDANIGRRLSEIGKVTFDKQFVAHTSGRRMIEEGVLKASTRYAVNYLSEVVLKKPITKRYNDIR